MWYFMWSCKKKYDICIIKRYIQAPKFAHVHQTATPYLRYMRRYRVYLKWPRLRKKPSWLKRYPSPFTLTRFLK